MRHRYLSTYRGRAQLALAATFLLLVGLVVVGAACAPNRASGLAAQGPAAGPAASPTPAAPAVGAPTAMPPSPKAYVGLFKDNAVAVLETGASPRLLSTIPVPTGPHGLVITPDGRRVYVSSDGDTKVSVIDTAADKVVTSIEVGKMPHGLAITPDGRVVLVAVFGAGQVAWIDTGNNQVIGQVAVPNPHNIAISPDGRTAYVAAQMPGKTGLAILDLAGKTVTGTVPLDKTPRALNFRPDGKELYFTLAGVDAVQVLDPATRKIVTQIPVGASPHHPLFTADGEYGLVVSQGPGELAIVDAASNQVARTVKVGKQPHWIAMDPGGKLAYVTNEGSNDLSVVDVEAGKLIATVPVGNAPRKLVVQPQTPGSARAALKTAIHGFAFEPKITVKAGQAIIWTNDDGATHTVTGDAGVWDSGNIEPGQSFSLTLDKPGSYSYHCMHHPYMQGVIDVTG